MHGPLAPMLVFSEKFTDFLSKNEKKTIILWNNLTSFSDACDRFVVADAPVAVVVKLCAVTDDDAFGFARRQCLSYRMPNKTIKYSINAKNTNSVHDISHT